MKIIYNFIYSDQQGKQQKFNMPVEMSKPISPELMYDICMSYLKIGRIDGTPMQAFSTSVSSPNYCFNPTDENCEKCDALKMSRKAEKLKNNSLEGKKIYIYEGKFAKVGECGCKTILKSFILPSPLLLNEFLMKEFKEEMNKDPQGMFWELVGITLVKELDPMNMTENEIKQYIDSEESYYQDNEDKAETERMIWAKVLDEKDERISWIPAIVKNGKIFSAIGELINPDSPDDMRKFDDCPIEGYCVTKEEK